ncbi:hypothetical protein E1A91_A06G183100v1 [Gossypium mustelinum]|uniref:Uncharacterized protein n=1 Tax=Gossypium mustelinum TaxID=34275 RepID=A0A5D2YZE2_GOSMU|nr:hypothetical protein E1A91_A06G183100v1 [Gossypium mustelinum]
MTLETHKKAAYYSDICVGSIACRLEKKEGGAIHLYIMTLGLSICQHITLDFCDESTLLLPSSISLESEVKQHCILFCTEYAATKFYSPKSATLILPPVHRPYRTLSVSKQSSTQSISSTLDQGSNAPEAYHIGCFSDNT